MFYTYGRCGKMGFTLTLDCWAEKEYGKGCYNNWLCFIDFNYGKIIIFYLFRVNIVFAL